LVIKAGPLREAIAYPIGLSLPSPWNPDDEKDFLDAEGFISGITPNL
jgi:hypothetical protein